MLTTHEPFEMYGIAAVVTFSFLHFFYSIQRFQRGILLFRHTHLRKITGASHV